MGFMRVVVGLAVVAYASAFAPGAMTGLRLKSAPAVSRRAATAPKMSLDAIEGAQQLLALAVWSAAYKQAGCDTPSWFGISQVAEDAPGIGLVAKAAPVYDGPSFREGLEYVFSFVWKPPILIAWKPR